MATTRYTFTRNVVGNNKYRMLLIGIINWIKIVLSRVKYMKRELHLQITCSNKNKKRKSIVARSEIHYSTRLLISPWATHGHGLERSCFGRALLFLIVSFAESITYVHLLSTSISSNSHYTIGKSYLKSKNYKEQGAQSTIWKRLIPAIQRQRYTHRSSYLYELWRWNKISHFAQQQMHHFHNIFIQNFLPKLTVSNIKS